VRRVGDGGGLRLRVRRVASADGEYWQAGETLQPATSESWQVVPLEHDFM
jgi:hypothetical protein